MDTNYLLILYGTSCLATWIFLFLFYNIYANESRLKRNGHNEPYISFLRKDYQKRCIGIALALPILLLTAYSIFWLFAGHPNAYNQLIYIFLIFLILVIPFPLMDIKKSKKEYKRMAMETGSEIIIDMKYKVLHRFFNPIIEVAFTILFTLYFVISKNNIPVLVFVHLLLPWLIYFSARNSKYLTKPLMKDGYLMIFSIITINFLIVLFYIYRYAIQCDHCGLAGIDIFSIVVFGLLLLKTVSSAIFFIQSRKYITGNLS